MRKLLLLSAVLIFGFASCSCDNFDENNLDLVTDVGVVIDGIRWATRNVDAPGTFAATPECAGMLFQWNKRRGWNATSETVEGWDNNFPLYSDIVWEAVNDPCPAGWRVPTSEELALLVWRGNVHSGEWTVQNGTVGLLFGVAPYQIFLPAAGYRWGGMLRGVGDRGLYWGNASSGNSGGVMLWFGGVRPVEYRDEDMGVGTSSRHMGYSIRCVAVE